MHITAYQMFQLNPPPSQMPDHSDDEDEYLYGSDEEPSKKKQKVSEPAKSADEKSKSPQKQSQDEDDEDDDESSDDDIEFVIGESAPKISTVTTTLGPLNDTIGAVNDDLDEDEKPKKTGTTIVAKDDGSSSVDVNAVAVYEGKPLTQIDLDKLKDKPWRIPGADISDYFNYGFDEFTWTAYCCKQDKLRGEFNPQKVMALMMGGPGGKMPQMPQMPFPFPGMPGFPNMKMPPMGKMPPMPPGMPPMGMPPMGMPPNGFKGGYKK